MQEGKDIIYLDETSTHMWEKRSRIWMPKENPIYLRLKKDRGCSRTIIGAICLKFPKMRYMICDKTNITNFRDFLDIIAKDVDAKNCVIVLDNHAAHKSLKSVYYAEQIHKFKLHFLPPAASELNPIERMWSYFKREWRLLLSDPNEDIDISNIDTYLRNCLEMVADKGSNLCKGPLKEILLANAYRFPDPRLSVNN